MQSQHKSGRIPIPLYRKIWWEAELHPNGLATMRLMAFNGKENFVIETHENVKVRISNDEDT